MPGVDVAAAIREPVTKLEDTAWRLRNASDTKLVNEATLTKAEKKRLTARIRVDVVADRHDKLRERAAAPRRGRAPDPYADLDAPFPTVEPVQAHPFPRDRVDPGHSTHARQLDLRLG